MLERVLGGAHPSRPRERRGAKVTKASDIYDFALAVKAFERMTLDEKRVALEHMATLQFRSVTDRFFEGVHHVVTASGEEPRP